MKNLTVKFQFFIRTDLEFDENDFEIFNLQNDFTKVKPNSNDNIMIVTFT